MPDPTLSEAIKEAYASAPTDVVVVDTLEITHPSFTQPIRVALSYTPITARLETTAPYNPGALVEFQAFAFDFVLPDVIDNGIPEMKIVMDNVSGEIMKHIEQAIPLPDKLGVIYRAFLSNDLSGGPHNDPPLHMTITGIEIDLLKVTATATIADFVNKQFPSILYDERRFPGLIAS